MLFFAGNCCQDLLFSFSPFCNAHALIPFVYVKKHTCLRVRMVLGEGGREGRRKECGWVDVRCKKGGQRGRGSEWQGVEKEEMNERRTCQRLFLFGRPPGGF